MTTEGIRVLVACGFFMLLLMLRLEAERFGAAEFSEPGERQAGIWTRLSWYLMAALLLAALYTVHPAPHDVLLMLVGHGAQAVQFGLALAALGIAQAAAFAWFRYGNLRLPPISAYPGAALTTLGTAIVDEVTFRGALLGTLVAIGTPDGAAILLATLAFVLATRMAAPGRHPYMVLLSLGMGLAFGWATLATGGVGAAIIGHVATSFAVFVCTGHAGQVPQAGQELEDVAARDRLPAGWQDARPALVARRGAKSRGLVDQIAPSGFVEREERRAAAQPSGGFLVKLRAAVRALTDPAEHPGGFLVKLRAAVRALTDPAEHGAR
jgi:membrane protease YdiL (CAAX protease family)